MEELNKDLLLNLEEDQKKFQGSKKNGNLFLQTLLSSLNDNDDFQIRCTVGRFTATDERKFEGHSIQDLQYEYK